MKKTIFIVPIIFGMLFFLLQNSSVMATPISSCADLNSSTQYQLTSDLINQLGTIHGSWYTCFYTNGANILFNCQGHRIDGQDYPTSRGFWMDSGSSNITLKNCIFSGFSIDTLIYGSSETIDNTTYLDGYAGFYGAGNFLINSRFYASTALEFNGVGDSNIINNTFFNQTGWSVASGASGNIFINNTFWQSTVSMGSSSGNIFYRNIFNSTTPYTSTGGGNSLNITPSSTGGGNFWANPSGTGFSQTCNDSRRIGFCNFTYTPSITGTDYFPLSIYPANYTVYKQSIKVNITENVTDYQIHFNVTNQSVGADWDWRFACYGKYKFTNKTQTANLSYYQEYCSESQQILTMWVKLNLTTLNGTQAYMSYGDLDWVSQSDPNSVFIFWDGFDHVICNPNAQPSCDTTINITKWNGTGQDIGTDHIYGCFKEYFGVLSCYGSHIIGQNDRYLIPNVLLYNNTLIEYNIQYVTKSTNGNNSVFLPYINGSRISVNGQTGGQNFQGKWSGGLAPLGDDLGVYRVRTILREGISPTGVYTNVTVPNGTTVTGIYQLEDPHLDSISFPTTAELEVNDEYIGMRYLILSPFKIRKYLPNTPSIEDPPVIDWGKELEWGAVEDSEQPQSQSASIIDLNSITGQLVLNLGFGIIGLFAVLTLLGFGYLETTGKPDPETIAKIMIGVVIIILMIVAVWSGIVTPP
jgi:hypothetical protein